MSEDTDTVQLNEKALKQLIAAFGATKAPTVRIGVLGQKNTRKDAKNGVQNAEIGARHEFDEKHKRSFLRMPLTSELKGMLEESGAFTPDVLAEVVRTGTIEAWMEKVGIVGVATVLEAFNTGGFGNWAPSNMAHKENKQTLVETKQLRDSITWDMK